MKHSNALVLEFPARTLTILFCAVLACAIALSSGCGGSGLSSEDTADAGDVDSGDDDSGDGGSTIDVTQYLETKFDTASADPRGIILEFDVDVDMNTLADLITVLDAGGNAVAFSLYVIDAHTVRIDAPLSFGAEYSIVFDVSLFEALGASESAPLKADAAEDPSIPFTTMVNPLDVDGDNKADLAIGNYYYEWFGTPGKGALLGGADMYSDSASEMPLMYDFSKHNDIWQIIGSRQTVGDDQYIVSPGVRSANLLDINGDGIADFMTGAVELESNRVEGTSLYTFKLSLWHDIGSGPSATFARVQNIDWKNPLDMDYASIKAKPIGDVNGDELNDFLIIESKIDYATTLYTNEVHLFLGGDYSGEVALSQSDASWFMEPGHRRNITAYGDFNCDGTGDLAINHLDHLEGTTEVYIHFGEANLTAFKTPMGKITSDAVGDYFGRAMAAGDVNGDGCDDLLIGAPYANKGEASYAYLFYGARDALQGFGLKATDADAIFAGPVPEGANDEFGWSVAIAEMVAPDDTGYGRADVLITARSAISPYGISRGIAYLYPGGDSLVGDIGLDSAVASFSSDLVGDASHNYTKFAAFMNELGDINNDGWEDVLIGGRMVVTEGDKLNMNYGCVFLGGSYTYGQNLTCSNASAILDQFTAPNFKNDLLGEILGL